MSESTRLPLTRDEIAALREKAKLINLVAFTATWGDRGLTWGNSSLAENHVRSIPWTLTLMNDQLAAWHELLNAMGVLLDAAGDLLAARAEIADMEAKLAAVAVEIARLEAEQRAMFEQGWRGSGTPLAYGMLG